MVVLAFLGLAEGPAARPSNDEPFLKPGGVTAAPRGVNAEAPAPPGLERDSG